MRLNDLGPRPADESRPVIALTPVDLACAVATYNPALVCADRRRRARGVARATRRPARALEVRGALAVLGHCGGNALRSTCSTATPACVVGDGRRSTYLNEFVWRWNARLSNRPMFGQLLLRAARN